MPRNKSVFNIIFIIIGLIGFAVWFFIFRETTIDFSQEFSEIQNESWVSIGSDGKWIKFDTNPGDYDIDDYYYLATRYFTEATETIQESLELLGFSSAVYEKMLSTTSLQGVQDQENENYIVTWSYHPDNGLEVMFESK